MAIEGMEVEKVHKGDNSEVKLFFLRFDLTIYSIYSTTTRSTTLSHGLSLGARPLTRG